MVISPPGLRGRQSVDQCHRGGVEGCHELRSPGGCGKDRGELAQSWHHSVRGGQVHNSTNTCKPFVPIFVKGCNFCVFYGVEAGFRLVLKKGSLPIPLELWKA